MELDYNTGRWNWITLFENGTGILYLIMELDYNI